MKAVPACACEGERKCGQRKNREEGEVWKQRQEKHKRVAETCGEVARHGTHRLWKKYAKLFFNPNCFCCLSTNHNSCGNIDNTSFKVTHVICSAIEFGLLYSTTQRAESGRQVANTWFVAVYELYSHQLFTVSLDKVQPTPCSFYASAHQSNCSLQVPPSGWEKLSQYLSITWYQWS